MNFVLSVAALSGVYLLVGGLERLPALRFRPLPLRRPYVATDTAWYLVAITATAISAFVFRPQLSKLAIGPLGQRVEHLPAIGQFVVALVVFDFVSFAVHVQLHRSAVLWNLHKVHHSTLQLDGFATTRAHMLENLVRFVPAQAVLFLIGVPVGTVTAVVATAAIYGISNHSNLRINLHWIESVLVTPRLHRRHHVPATTRHNYGTVFTIWDRLFGTVARRDTTPDERFGVPGQIDTYPQRFATAARQPLVDIQETRRVRRSIGR